MNAAIYQFKAFEDASLEYADEPGTAHDRKPIGLWDTVMQPGETIEDVLERVAEEESESVPAVIPVSSPTKTQVKKKRKGKKK